MPSTKLLLVSAMSQELTGMADLLAAHRQPALDLVIETIGIGKVAAAAHTQRLIQAHRPTYALLVGVAGALQPHLRLGDVGVVCAAIDADLDVRAWRPGFVRGEHPLTRERLYRSEPRLIAAALATQRAPVFSSFVATGSSFLDTPGKAAFRRDVLPALEGLIGGETRTPDLIDMETSAFLQVAHQNKVPALALRVVSDTLEGDAVADFEAFLQRASTHYAGVIQDLLPHLAVR